MDGIEWALTEKTKADTVADVRTRAVEDARRKATTYAEALGLADLRCVAVADPGMLGDHGSGGRRDATWRTRGLPHAEGAGGLSFTPEDIAVSAAVDARFAATCAQLRGTSRGCRGRPARARWPRTAP